jgi:hypothetical protein
MRKIRNRGGEIKLFAPPPPSPHPSSIWRILVAEINTNIKKRT